MAVAVPLRTRSDRPRLTYRPSRLGLHHAYRYSWPWLAITTLAGAAAFTAPPPLWARKAWSLLDRPAECIYTAAVATIAGGWLTVATALGPATMPIPIVGAILTAVCGIPWWVSRKAV